MKSKKLASNEVKGTVTKIEIKDEGPTLYCNHAEVRISPWDFKLSMGEVRGFEAGTLSVKNLASIFMSPPHAKIFAKILSEKVNQYESKFGTIISAE